jgi:tetratricopeptide (TPR) repeat protein
MMKWLSFLLVLFLSKGLFCQSQGSKYYEHESYIKFITEDRQKEILSLRTSVFFDRGTILAVPMERKEEGALAERDYKMLATADLLIKQVQESGIDSLLISLKDAYMVKGIVFFQLKDYRFALQQFAQAERYADPQENDSGVVYHKGKSKYWLKDYRGAINEFTRLIDGEFKLSKIEFVNSLTLRAYCYLVTDKLDESIGDYKRAYGIAPNNPTLLHNYGLTLIQVYKNTKNNQSLSEGCDLLSKSGENGGDVYSLIEEYCN